MKRIPGWAWAVLAIILIALVAWWLTGDKRVAGGAVAAPVAVQWLRRARRLREEADDICDPGPELDEAEQAGIAEAAVKWRNGGGL